MPRLFGAPGPSCGPAAGHPASAASLPRAQCTMQAAWQPSESSSRECPTPPPLVQLSCTQNTRTCASCPPRRAAARAGRPPPAPPPAGCAAQSCASGQAPAARGRAQRAGRCAAEQAGRAAGTQLPAHTAIVAGQGFGRRARPLASLCPQLLRAGSSESRRPRLLRRLLAQPNSPSGTPARTSCSAPPSS